MATWHHSPQAATTAEAASDTVPNAESAAQPRTELYFSLAEGSYWHRRRRERVDIGIPEQQIRQRFGSPLNGRRLELLVLARTELDRVERYDMRIDCRRILSAHLTGTAQISSRHDGRNRGFVTQALALRTDMLTTNFVRLITAVCAPPPASRSSAPPPADIFITILYCKHGRHRSVSVAMLYAILLTILGADVTLTLATHKRCTCVECDDSSIIQLLPGIFADWATEISNNIIAFLRVRDSWRHRIHCEDLRRILHDIIEFLDYCPMGY